jgi:VCBS repeat protein
MRLPFILAAALCAASAGADGHGQNFLFVEQSNRLPVDTSLPGTSTTDVDLVDVDHDGDLDLFIAEGTDSPAPRPNRLLINDGHAFFTDETATRLPPGQANSTKADFGDVDGDGDLDAIVANLGPEQLLINDGSGVFMDASAAQLPPPPTLFQDITADARLADVDGDGDLDVLLSNENPFDPSPTGGGQNRVWINEGTGRFTDETAARLPARTDQTGAMLPGDIDGDDDLDVVVLNRGQDFVLVNDGHGFFTDETAGRFPVTSDSSRGGALVDLDGDGDLDVYLPNAGAFTVGHGFGGGPDRYFRNNGRARFQERTDEHFPGVNDPTTDAAFGDIDGDGDLDLVVGNSGANGSERVFIQRTRGHGDDD